MFRATLRQVNLSRSQSASAVGIGLAFVAFIITMIVAWVTHVVVSIQTASWILLIVGIFVPPIGWIHGIGSWFGAF